jgi:hypothetical protein
MRTVVLILLAVGLGVPCYAQQARLTVSAIDCAEGKKYYQYGLDISVFDVEKVPEIVKLDSDLSNLFKSSFPTSDDVVFDKSLRLFEQLEKRVHETTPLVHVKNSKLSKYTFRIPPVKRVIIIAIGQSESAAYMYATKSLDVSVEQPNLAVLNFASDEECKAAKWM